MKNIPTHLLRVVIALMGVAVVVFDIFALYQGIFNEKVGYYRPILIGLSLTTIPVLLAFFQTFKLLNYIDREQAFSQLSVKAIQIVRYCALAVGIIYSVGMPYIYYVAEIDDAPGVILFGLAFIFASIVMATFATVFGRILQNALDIKSENDLTV